LNARGAKAVAAESPAAGPHLERLDLGERMLGDNLLSATVVSGPGHTLRLELTSPAGRASRFEGKAAADGTLRVPYTLADPCPAYAEYRGTLTLLDDSGTAVTSGPLWFATWTTPIDLELGGLYLRPPDKQFVRVNLGLSSAAMAK